MSAEKQSFTSSISNGLDLIRNGHTRLFFRELKRRLYSRSYAFGLRRDMEKPFPHPEANIPIRIRRYKPEDFEPLMDYGELEKTNPRLVKNQRGVAEAGMETCYVAVTEKDEPTYMQWLMGADQNDKIQAHFGNIFPRLKPGEALLEAAFMRPSFRGKRIMPEAMSKIASKTDEMPGVRYAMTFVEIHNIPSLKGCRRCGFSPFILRTEQWFLFKRRVSFGEIPAGIMEEYEQTTGQKRSG